MKSFKGFDNRTKRYKFTAEIKLRHIPTDEEQEMLNYTFALKVPVSAKYYRDRPLPETHAWYRDKDKDQVWNSRLEADVLAVQHLHVELCDRIRAYDSAKYALDGWLYRGDYRCWATQMPSPIIRMSTHELEGGTKAPMSDVDGTEMRAVDIANAQAIALSKSIRVA